MPVINRPLIFLLISSAIPCVQADTDFLSGVPVNPLSLDTYCLGMGNACTAIAERGESIDINPAAATGETGLAVNVQVRYARQETVYLDQEGVNSEALGTNRGQLYMPLEENRTDVSNAGITIPWGRWAFSGFYRKSMGFDSATTRQDRYNPDREELYVSVNSFSSHLETWGASAALEFFDDWSLGVSVLSSSMDLQSDDAWEAHGDNPGNALIYGHHIDDEASDTVFQAGLAWRPDGPFLFGFSYREGETFDFRGHVQDLLQGPDGTLDRSRSEPYRLEMYDRWSLGIGWRVMETWLLSADYVRLMHSSMPQVRDYSLVLNVPVDDLTEAIEDTNSFRLGVEKTFCGSRLPNCFALRLGIMTEEDHDGMRYVQGYDTQFTAGFGTSFGQRHRFDLDFAAQGGDEEILFMTSLSYRPRNPD